MQVLVTGGGGFLGTEIIRQIRQRWPELTISSLSRSHHPHLDIFGVMQHQIDLQDRTMLWQAVKGVDCIIHTAAKAGVWGSYRDYAATNVSGTQHILEVCYEQNIPYLIYTSSPSVTFQGQDQEGENENSPYPKKFLNHYSHTKALAEQMVLAANSPELRTVALRPHLIWGPGDPHLVKRIHERAGKGKLKLIKSIKECLVDSTYITNAAFAHILALEKFLYGRADHIAGKAYFISNGEPQPINELITNIAIASGAPAPSKKISFRLALIAGSVLEAIYNLLGIKSEPLLTRFVAKQMSTHHWFDLSAAQRDLGYTPLVSIKDGLAALTANPSLLT